MDNYKKVYNHYLFDIQQTPQEGYQKVYSFGAGIGASEFKVQQNDLINYLDPGNNSENSRLVESQFDEEYKKDFLKTQIKSLREKLIVMGFPTIGDLFNNSISEVQTSVKSYNIQYLNKSLFAMIQQRKQDMDFRNTVHDKIGKIENERNQFSQNLDRTSTQKKNLETEVGQLQTKLKSQEKASKDQMSKILQEKDEIQKNYLKIQNMKAQFEHELKQKDQTIQKLQEHLKKAQGQKSHTFKNSLEVVGQLEQQGPNLFTANGEFEFSQMVMRRWEEINKKLQIENETLKDNLMRINQELNDILAIRKEIFIKRRKIDYGDDYAQNFPSELEKPEQSMIQFNKDLFKSPLDSSCKDAVGLLQDNLQNFKELMKKFDNQYDLQIQEEDLNLEGDVQEVGKLRACKNLSELFKNYNYVFETQDKMINQIISKSQGLQKMEELNHNINRFNRVMDDKQIEEVRSYLQEQKSYLDESKNEMDQIKKQFQGQLKKREDDKQMIQVKRTELEEANEKFKENIRMLQSASKQAIQNLLQNEELNDKRILQENSLN